MPVIDIASHLETVLATYSPVFIEVTPNGQENLPLIMGLTLILAPVNRLSP